MFNFFNNPKKMLEEVEVYPGVFLSKALAEKWPEINQTARTCIKITAIPSDTFVNIESNFGYYPFLPKGFAYPLDEEGKPMLPLAQLNFAEMPALNGYPQKGLLQFYIADNDMYGIDFDNPFNQQSFRVVYFDDIESLEEEDDLSFIKPLLESGMSPVSKPHRLEFTIATEYLGLGDVANEAENALDILDYIEQKHPKIEDELEKEVYAKFLPLGHKVGGYAYFTQTDPRIDDEITKDYVLLFQMDSDDEIMWGDVGVGNFFIHPDDLAKRDFSKVMYNWDCS